ncbi:MAG: cytochrome c [Pedosphaera sp.]|nr:cytochrome c [Pedosphaera sp.]
MSHNPKPSRRDRQGASNRSDGVVRGGDVNEPVVELKAVPLWLVVLLGVLFYWAQLHLDHNAAGFQARVYGSFDSFAQVDSLQPKSDTEALLARGKVVYEQACGVCHQPTGLGSQSPLAPPLAGSEWVNTPGPGRMIRIALYGLQGEISVKGEMYNAAMPGGVGESLSDADLAAAISYIRQAWGNKASLVSPQQIKAVKEKMAGHPQWTAEDLLQFPADE